MPTPGGGDVGSDRVKRSAIDAVATDRRNVEPAASGTAPARPRQADGAGRVGDDSRHGAPTATASAAPAAPHRPARRFPLPGAAERHIESGQRCAGPRCRRPQPGRMPRSTARLAWQRTRCDVAADLLMDQRLDRHRSAAGASVRVKDAASAALRRSVISIEPGAWVMQNSGFTAAITACGVTPQAQNTGNSSVRIRHRVAIIRPRQSRMPIAAGSPRCTGAPCTDGKARRDLHRADRVRRPQRPHRDHQRSMEHARRRASRSMYGTSARCGRA